MSSFALPGPLSLGGMAVPNRLVAGMHDQDVMLYVVPLLSDNGYLEGHLRAGKHPGHDHGHLPFACCKTWSSPASNLPACVHKVAIVYWTHFSVCFNGRGISSQWFHESN